MLWYAADVADRHMKGRYVKLDSAKVRWHRDRLGWTLDTLAETAEVAEGTALRAEHGEDIRPSSGRRIARAFGVDISELVPDRPGVLVHPLAETPGEPGSSLLDRALDAARQDEEKDAGVMAREFASEGVAAEVASGYAEDKVRAELRKRGYPDEDFDGFIWPLVVRVEKLEQKNAYLGEENARLKEENARLREEVANVE
jgi:transcriptional regulator with XRE-family HTH domain